MKFSMSIAVLALAGLLSACASPPPPPQHPAYMHALSDLRAARWLIEHRPGNWAQTNDEVEAVRQIDAAIGDLKQAAYDDGKNLDYHPPVDEINERRGRLHRAIEYMRSARHDISAEEDNVWAIGLRNHAIGHIDGSINATKRAVGES